MTKKKNLAHSSNYTKASRTAANIKYIVIHYTGNDGDTDEANANYFTSPNRQASAHYFVDDDSYTISVEPNNIAWAVGGGKYSDCSSTGGGKLHGIACNSNSISVEMCDTKKDGKYAASEKTLKNTYALVASLMVKYGVDINHVIRHFDVNGKHCPAYLMNETKWKKFKTALNKVYKEKGGKDTTTTTSTYTPQQFVKDVQKILGHTVTGTATNATLKATVTISKSTNSKHALVQPIQKRLNPLGFDCGTADGVAGAKFDSAVKAYQSNKGCVVDGELTAKGKTWSKILKLS